MQIAAGKFRSRKLHAPSEKITRPTSSKLRQALFNICQTQIKGIHFLDLFAGSGAMGFEALSREAASATFIDNHREAISCIKRNSELLQVQSQCHIIQADIFVALKRLASSDKQFHIIYVDPPYHLTHSQNGKESICSKLLNAMDSTHLLSSNGVLYIEREKSTAEILSLKNLVLAEQRQMGPSLLEKYCYKLLD